MTNDQPVVSVDPVALSFGGSSLHVALARRIYPPHVGDLALPGVMLLPGESIHEAALRGLTTKAHINVGDVRYEKSGGFNDESNRDPRGATISLTQIFILNPQVELESISPSDIENLPFSHAAIIAAALDDVSAHLFTDPAIIPAFLGQEFTAREVSRLMTALGMKVDGNLARKLASIYASTDERVSAGSVGAPSRVFTTHPRKEQK